MPTPHPTRRPRFLAEVPEVSPAEPVRFAPATPRAAPGARESSHAPAQASAAAPAPDLSGIRREAMERVAAAVETLRAQADRLAEQARADAIEIGFQVARKVLEAELRQDPEALFALVRSALRRAGESRRIAVRLAPADAALVASDSGRGALEGLTSARVEFLPDASLQPGDCLVDTDFGQVDGRLGTRLAEIRRAVDSVEGAA